MSAAPNERAIPAPAIDPENRPFWEAAADGRLLLKRCMQCTRPHHYPRALCPFCGSDRTEWFAAAGTGSVYTFSVTRRAGPVAYAIAYVTLDEGVTMLTNLVDCDLDAIRIGDRVRVVFRASDGGQPVPMFAPAR